MAAFPELGAGSLPDQIPDSLHEQAAAPLALSAAYEVFVPLDGNETIIDHVLLSIHPPNPYRPPSSLQKGKKEMDRKLQNLYKTSKINNTNV